MRTLNVGPFHVTKFGSDLWIGWKHRIRFGFSISNFHHRFEFGRWVTHGGLVTSYTFWRMNVTLEKP